jgi:hypothetical protein
LFRKAEPIGPPSFLAEVVHLLAFTSDRWKGWWWETLRWKLLAVLMNPGGSRRARVPTNR